MRQSLTTSMLFSSLLLLTAPVYAVGGGAGGAPSPSRAPIGAPPSLNSNEVNSSYEFRNRMSSDPACQELARQSDAAYMNSELTDEQKKQALEQIRARAKSAGCTG